MTLRIFAFSTALLLAISGFLFANQATAGRIVSFFTNTEMQGACEDDTVVSMNACIGYVAATVDLYRALSDADEVRKYLCIDHDVKVDQVIKIYLKYLDDHPETLHHSASGTIFYALAYAFPCDVLAPENYQSDSIW